MNKVISKIKVFSIYNILKKFNKIFKDSPIFVSGLALTPIIAGAITLKYSVLIITVMCLIYIPVSIFAIIFGKYIKSYRRDFIFSIIATLIFPIASKIADNIDQKSVINLGIYLPIIVVDSLILVHANEYSNDVKENIFKNLKKLIFTIIGFVIPCLLMGAIREYIAFGTLWDKVIVSDNASRFIYIPQATQAFVGFIFLGFMAAIYQKLSMYRKREINLNQEVDEVQ